MEQGRDLEKRIFKLRIILKLQTAATRDLDANDDYVENWKRFDPIYSQI